MNNELLQQIQNEVATEVSGHSAKTLREFIELEFPYYEQETFINTLCSRYAAACVEERDTRKWISVKEREPKALSWVMVWVPSRKMAFMVSYRAYQSEAGSMWDDYQKYGIDPNEFELWQPLPSPPHLKG